MAEFNDITEWNEKPWYQTSGTRSKVIVENPANQADYYFKTSPAGAEFAIRAHTIDQKDCICITE